MATEAARLERKESTGRIKRKNRKTCLTHTGLLMEGNQVSIAFRKETAR
jgi:hypothetical protein